MPKAREKEAYPLMEKPVPVRAIEMGFQQPSPAEPGFLPPPYSSVVGSQSQGYSPMAPVSAQAPYPTSTPQMPGPPQQETLPYFNPIHQVLLENGKAPPPQTVYNPTCYPAVYDPMANIPPPLQGAAPNQTIIVSSQSAASNGRKRCRYLKICAVIGTILVAIGVGIRVYQRSQHRRELREQQNQKRLQEELERHRMYAPYDPNDWDQLEREINSMINQQQNNYQNRYKRSFEAFQSNYKDYDFDSLNDVTMAMVNTLVESGKISTERPRGSETRTWSLYRLFKRSADQKLTRSSEISVT